MKDMLRRTRVLTLENPENFIRKSLAYCFNFLEIKNNSFEIVIFQDNSPTPFSG